MGLQDFEIHELQNNYNYLMRNKPGGPWVSINPLSYRDSNGNSLLHIAAQCGDLRAIELLLRGGLDVNLVGDKGNTALHCARTKGAFNLLLALGASREVVNKSGDRPEFKQG